MEQKHRRRCIGVFTLTMINFAAIFGLRNLPFMATCGLAMFFFYTVAALVFFMPTALVAAELATAWPEGGGLYAWVKLAMGPRWGFAAIWLQTVISFITFPITLAYMGAALAYCVDRNLANNKAFMFALIVVVFWLFTFLNLRGMRLSGLISAVGSFVGTLIPGVLIIGLGTYWVLSGKPCQLTFSLKALLPSCEPQEMVRFSSLMLAFCGMEMSAFHAREVIDPKRSYPRAAFFSMVLILVVSVLGSMAIALVVPHHAITLQAGTMQAFSAILDYVGLHWATPIVALLLVIGAIAFVSTWVVGPPRGLLEAADSGFLPKLLQKENKAGMPVTIMLVQAVAVTIFSAFFLIVPNASTAFWMLTIIATQLNLLVYVLMFISVIKLRKTHAHVERPYKIPGGAIGLGVVAGFGLLSSFFCIVIGFVPPGDLDVGSTFQFVGLMALGTVLMLVPPSLFVLCNKPVQLIWQK